MVSNEDVNLILFVVFIMFPLMYIWWEES